MVLDYKKFKSQGVIKVVEEGVSDSLFLSYFSSFWGKEWNWEVMKMDDHSWLASFPSKEFLQDVVKVGLVQMKRRSQWS